MTDFKAEMHQIRFRLGLRPRPRCGSLQRSPDPLAGFGGRFAAGGGLGRGREGKGGWEGEGGGSGGEGKGGPEVTVEPGPLRALLRHWVNLHQDPGYHLTNSFETQNVFASKQND